MASTSGLGGGVGLYGSKGPDLIETIRLEKIVGNPYLGPAGSSGISYPHPAVDVGRRVAVRRPRTGLRKEWAEPAWNYPTLPATVRVHDEEQHAALNESGPADDAGTEGRSPSPIGSQSPLGSHVASQVSHKSSRAPSRAPSHTPSGPVAVRPQTAPAGGTAHKRELLREQWRTQQEGIQQRLQVSRAQRRAKEERDFAQAWDNITKTEAGLVADVQEMLDIRKEDARRKQEGLHREWHADVFERIQGDIDGQIRERVRTRDLGERWREAQDDYLAACKRKEAGLFRDIIIPDEYDPLICRAKDIKYRLAIDDPLKLELNTFKTERKMMAAQRGQSVPPEVLGRDSLPPTMWDKLEATPYGRFDKMMAAGNAPQNAQKAAAQKSAIPFDHFSFDRSRAVVDREFPPPKRTFASRR